MEALGRIKPSHLGFALLETWSICLLFTQIDRPLPDAGGVLGLDYGTLTNFSSIAVVLGTLALLLFFRRQADSQPYRILTIVACAVSVFSTPCILFGPTPLMAVGFVLSGLANAWLWVSWGNVFCSLDTEAAEHTAIASAILEAVAIAVVLLLPDIAQTAALIALIPISVAMYLVAVRQFPLANRTIADHEASQSPIRFDARSGFLTIAGLGIPVAILYYLLYADLALPVIPNGFDLTIVFGLLLFVVVLFGFVRFTPSMSSTSIGRTTTALLVVAVSSYAIGASALLAHVVLFSLILLCQYLFIMYGARLARHGFASALLTFSAVWLVNHTSGLVGTGLSALVHDSGAVTAGAPFAITAVVMLTVAFALVFVLKEYAPAPAPLPEAVEPSESGTAVDESERTMRIAREHGLSAREIEVLELLAKGRSAPFIRDELVISLNTVNSHIKRIYTKLDVHSRQELLDLMDVKNA